MRTVRKNSKKRSNGELGASFVEMALLLSLIMIVCIPAVSTLGYFTTERTVGAKAELYKARTGEDHDPDTKLVFQ